MALKDMHRIAPARCVRSYRERHLMANWPSRSRWNANSMRRSVFPIWTDAFARSPLVASA